MIRSWEWVQQYEGITKVTDPSVPLSCVSNNGGIAIGVNSEGEFASGMSSAHNDESSLQSNTMMVTRAGEFGS